MIVRISGTGQFELDEGAVRRLDELDTALTEAFHAGDEEQFCAHLRETVKFIREAGTPLSGDRVLPSDVIVPPEDSGMEDARDFMSDEGLMQPLEA